MTEQPSESFTQGSVTYKKGADGKWYFNVKAKNGEIVAQSEGYEKLSSAYNGLTALAETLAADTGNWTVEVQDDGA